MNLKILSFNWHEPYLCLLAGIGNQFLIVEPETTDGKYRRWDKNMRPIPSNVHIISEDQAISKLDEGEIDLIIAHNIKDLIKIKSYVLPKILIFHNKLSTEIELGNHSIKRENYLNQIKPLLIGIKKVFISDSKRLDWGMDGDVILPGLDIDHYGGYIGEKNSILRVGNLLKERDLMMGYSFSEAILSDLPSVTLGLNPSIKESRLSLGFEDLIHHYRSLRLFLNTTVEKYEDGYNLALLEAMAIGMPIISTANKTSPIINNVNGFISNDIQYLKQCAIKLLDDSKLAKTMGENSRETIKNKFSKSNFINHWNGCIEKTIYEFLDHSGVSLSGETRSFGEKTRKNILMDYVSYPATTAFYMERSFRKISNVITCGESINDALKKEWDLENLNWPIAPQDICRSSDGLLSEVISKLPNNWFPDFYLWIETGLSEVPPDLKNYNFPKACYLIDTHINLEQHKIIGSQFDFVFIAQKKYVNILSQAGCKNVIWIPLACDPEIHGQKEIEKIYEVGFVGTIGQENSRRKKLLDSISNNFNLYCGRLFMDEMASLYSSSMIVFNSSIKNDLNMRVFEALCSGSLLLTDSSEESGLEWLFEDGKHLAIYEDKSLIESIRYYLSRPDLIEKIATAGREEVLKNHTYDHRIKSIIKVLDEYYSVRNEVKEKKISQYYKNVRHDILPLIPDTANCILEVGCAAGMTGNELKKKNEVFVAGIEMNSDAAFEASKVLDDVVEGNIETMEIPYEENSFDCILFADILEHLMDPLKVLKKIKRFLKNGGSIVASLPNVQYFGLVNHLIEGNWTYEDEGILDRTHLRFFTFLEIEKLFKNAGYEIIQIDETLDSQYEKARQNPSELNVGRLKIQNLSPEEFKRFFVYQYKVVAKLKELPLSEQSYQPFKENFMKDVLENGKSLEMQGLYNEALKIYEAVETQHSNYVEVLAQMGNCYMHLQDLSNAEKSFRLSLNFLPDGYTANIGLGLLQLQLNNLVDSIKIFKNVIKYNPTSDKAWIGLGIAYRKNEKLIDAMNAFNEALKINLENDSAMTNLLELSYQVNKFDQIELAMNRYNEYFPKNVNILFGLAGIQYKLNRNENVYKLLSEILSLDSEHADAIALLDKINSPIKSY